MTTAEALKKSYDAGYEEGYSQGYLDGCRTAMSHDLGTKENKDDKTSDKSSRD
jgi:flagellar biosynthesis/type III secretory pathway protein FliH